MRLCSSCKSWKDCPGFYSWFPMQEIKFCPLQVRWLLEHLTILESGKWPAEIDTKHAEPSNRQPAGNASFEKPVEHAAEIRRRIEKVDKVKPDRKSRYNDGLLTLQILTYGWDENILARLMRTDVNHIHKKIDRVIRYISGNNMRSISYEEYCQKRKSIIPQEDDKCL